MATYVNDLRLKEIATGDEAGTWGTSTNTNLELIGEALGFGTQDCFSSDADATTTVADGSTDPARAIYFKVTSSATLTATRTLTIAPNTISRLMFIENATTGSQSITISQGSGASVTITTGKTKVVYLDGAGSGAAVVDAMAGVDPGVTDTLAEVLAAGNTTGGTSLVVSSGDDVTFTGASANVVFDSSDSALEFADNAKAKFGTGGDLQIYHDGSASFISDQGTGNLKILATDLQIRNAGDSGTLLTAVDGGAVTLKFNSNSKLATTNTGIDVTGVITTDGMTTSANINFGDNDKAVFGAGSDLEIFHDGTDSFISESNSSGSLFIKATHLYLQNSSGQDALNLINGNAFLKSGGSTKLETTSTGISVTGDVSVSGDLSVTNVKGASDANTKIEFLGSDRTRFVQGGAEKARFDASGNFLVNGTNATGKLVVDGDANAYTARFNSSTTTGQAFGLRVRAGTNSSDFAVLVENTSASSLFSVRGDGAVDVANTMTTAGLTVAGDTLSMSHTGNTSTISLTQKAGTQNSIATISANREDTTTSASRLIFSTNDGSSTKQRIRISNNGDISFYEDTGTTAKLFFDASAESLGIGTSSPEETLSVMGDFQVALNTSVTGRGLKVSTSNSSITDDLVTFNAQASTGILKFQTNSSNRALIDASGNFLVGKTSADNETQGVRIYSTGRQSIVSEADTALIINRRTSVGTVVSFRKDATQVGTISVTASATAYNTSSDQRLKDNIVDAPSASDDIDAIQVRSFDWKGDGLHQKYGMVAQELQEVAPEAVTGDADSDEMMSVDYSKLVPMMMKEIQSLRARVAQLEGVN